jgi:hypothetical protein
MAARDKGEPRGGPQTRVYVPVRARDGSAQQTLVADLDGLACPVPDSPVLIDADYGVSAYVQGVALAPTCDPAAYVNCRAVVVADAAEVAEVVKKARACGWLIL